MIVEGQYRFRGPRSAVFALLQDPDVLARALPGAKALSRTAPDRFEGVMSVGIGPVTAGEFTVVVELRDLVPPERLAMRVEGKGGIGFTRGSATVALAEGASPEETVMTYRADLQVGGKIAGVGQRLLDSASRTMTRQGLEAMNRELQARLGAERTPSAPGGGEPRLRPRATAWVAGVALALVVMIGFCALGQ